MHGAVRPGDRLHVSAPRNHFRLDESARRLIFVAGGIGITPIAAMARRARELGMAYALHYSGRRRAPPWPWSTSLPTCMASGCISM
jgi:ferredoxin-NADP reductase